jgi:hypothetical protein
MREQHGMAMATPEPSSPALPPAGGLTRMIRTYARRDDAERALSLLGDHGVEAAIQEFWAPDAHSGERVLRGCALLVRPEDASVAARLIMKMPPSEAPGGQRGGGMPVRTPGARGSGSGGRLMRRVAQPEKQRGSILMIGIAIIGAASFLLYAGNQLLGKKQRAPVVEEGPETYSIDEDLNGDSVADAVREYTPGGRLVSWQEDRNFDGTMDVRWIWQGDRLAYRDRDIDGNGKWDERTTFDPEGYPFYTDLRPDGTGAVRLRKVFRDGVLWRTLEDRDGDTRFDAVLETDEGGDILRREALGPDAPEHAVPKYPLPPLPPRDFEGMSAPLKAMPPVESPAPPP